MTDKGLPDDDDEGETLAGDTTAPIDQGTEGAFDLESLPGKRPVRQPPPATPVSPPRRKLPEADDFFEAPAETAPPAFEPQATEAMPGATELPERATLLPEGATEPPPGATEAPSSSETPTREIDLEREMPTMAGTFAGSTAGAAAPATADPDEAATIAEVPGAGPSAPRTPAAKGTLGTDQSGRKLPTAWKSPLTKGGTRTARDPIAGTAALRGSQPGSRSGGATVLAEGQLLADRYELVTRLGKGGMGEVWKAKHILLQGMRAIKVIKASISMDPSFRQRFLKEGQTMMRVKHPGVVEVTDLDETRANRELFMVMEYLEGRTIYDAVRDKTKPLSDVREVVRILREVAVGMQRIHDERIVHKDLKSDNVLLVKGEDGLEHPKVIDFGLAKSLGDRDVAPADGAASSPAAYDPDLHTTLSGTLAYMAPEQFRSEPSSFQSDIYALGVMGYEMFTGGEYPLPRGSITHYMDLHKKGTPPERLAAKRPDLDPALTAILDRCMAPSREMRPESCKEVAKDLQWWLDIPVRAAARRAKIKIASGVAAVAAVLVWAIFFGGEKTASLSNLAVTSEAAKFTFDGKTAHVPQAALASLVLTADIAGKPGEPVLEIDGKRRDVKSEVGNGQLVVTADLSDVPDGLHNLALRASPSASPANFAVDVDRKAPQIRGVTLRGAVTDSTGIYTSAQSPEVVVDVAEPAEGIAEVVAYPSGGGQPVTAQRDAGGWVLLGTAPGDGKVAFDVAVRDLARNETRVPFTYVRDTKPPVVSVADDYKSDSAGSTAREVRVRPSQRPKLAAHVKDASSVELKVGDAEPVVRAVDGFGDVEFDVGSVTAAGLPSSITVRDRAGNSASREFLLRSVPDELDITDGEGRHDRVLGPDDQLSVVAWGKYAIDESMQLTATRIRDASGAEVKSAAPQKLPAPVFSSQREGCTLVLGVSAKSLAEGTYRLGVILPGEVAVKPYDLTVDGTPPVIESCSVAEAAAGRLVPDGAFALKSELVITAEVTDLSPERVTLGGQPAQEPPSPGRHTYTFRVTCQHEGANTWALVVQDGAKNSTPRSVTVKADWTAPSPTLSAPVAGADLDDANQTMFRGRCENEEAYDVVVEFPDGTTRTASFQTPDFELPVILPPGENVPVNVYAVDAAKHRSSSIPLALSVRHVGKDLPPEITSRHGVTALMEQVEPGDVVIGGRVQPVARAFVDRCEVTNADYRTFLAATKASGGHGAWCHPDEPKGWDHTPAAATWNDPKWNADGLPVVNVAYWDAHAFAVWSDRRLPTEAEWVKAAAKSKLKGETELRKWPPFAPGEWRDGVIATSECAKGPVPAATGDDVSPVGCRHMGGNVSEWVELADPAASSPAGTRGGSWFFSKAAADVKDTPAKAWNRSFRANTIGFRCAVDAAKVQP